MSTEVLLQAELLDWLRTLGFDFNAERDLFLMLKSQFELQNSSVFKNQFITTQQFWIHKTIPVGMFMCEFKTKYFEQALFSQMNIPLPSELSNAVPKRKSEFLAGRHCVKQLAKAFKISNVDSIEVKVGRHREPIWPLGVKGSITHNTSTALCLMSNSSRVCSLGIDIENIVTEELMGNITSQICCPQELMLLVSQWFDKCEAFTLIFSAKESIFKAFYPKVGNYFDFKEAALKDVDLPNSRMRFQFNESFTRKFFLPKWVDVDFMVSNGIVLTAVTL